MKEIIIYKGPDNSSQVEVRFEGETFWLTQKQIADVFGTEVPAINKHIKNIIREKELPGATISKMEIVQKEGKRSVKRAIEVYNLDMIISIGYRVNSTRATRFRIWATQRLKDYLVKGAAINQKRLDELCKMVDLIAKSGKTDDLHVREAQGLLEIIQNYTQSFVLLNQYDARTLKTGELSKHITYEIEYDEAVDAFHELRSQLMKKGEATKFFGNEKDRSFKSSLKSIVQTFGGENVPGQLIKSMDWSEEKKEKVLSGAALEWLGMDESKFG